MQQSIGREDLFDCLVLVLNFLESSVSLPETASKLREEVRTFLPQETTWNGKMLPARLPDSISGLSKNHLLRSLRTLGEQQPSLLATTITALSAETDRRLFGKKLLTNQQKRALVFQEINKLLNLKAEERRLLRELQSERGRGENALQLALTNCSSAIEQQRDLCRPLFRVAQQQHSLSFSLLDRQKNAFNVQCQAQKLMVKRFISQLRVLKRVTGHRGPAYSMATNHPAYIFTGADDGFVRMWNPQNGRLHSVLCGNRQVVTDIDCTHTFVCSSSGENSSPDDNHIRVWEISTSRQVICFPNHLKSVLRVNFSFDGNYLFSSAEDGTCVAWDMKSVESQFRQRDVLRQTWIDRERRLREPSENLEIQLELDCPPFHSIVPLPLVFPHVKNHKLVPLVCQAVHPTRNIVATGSEDSVARIWSVDPIPQRASLSPETATLPNLISGPYVDGADHLMATLCGHSSGFISHIEFSHDGTKILTYSSKDGTARVWFWRFGDLFLSKPHHHVLKARGDSKKPAMINSAAFSQNDAFVVTTQSVKPAQWEGEDGFWDALVCVWNVGDGSLLRFMRGHRMAANITRMHPEHPWLGATCGSDGLIIFWDFHAGEEIHRLNSISSEGNAAVFDAKWCLSSHSPVDFCTTDSMLRINFIGTGEMPLEFSTAPVEQFSSHESRELIFHGTQPLDAQLQLPLHLLRQTLCNAFREEYPDQPPPLAKGQGCYLEPLSTPTSDVERRLAQTQQQVRVISGKEQRAQEALVNILASQDEKIEAAKKQDLLDAALALKDPETGALVKKTKTKKVTAKSPGLLALERQHALYDSDSLGEEEEPIPASLALGEGRNRRAAARQANRSIHRAVQRLVDPIESPGVAISSRRRRFEDNEVSLLEEEVHSLDDDDEEDEIVGDFDEDDEDDDEGEEVEEDYDDEEEENVGGGRGRRRYTTRGIRQDYSAFDDFEPQISVSNPPPPRLPPPQRDSRVTFSNDWLMSTSPSVLVPQVGDEVVYFPQGHAEYLHLFPSTESPPWQAWDIHEWAFVVCRVMAVDYVLPTDSRRFVLARVSLKVTRVKGKESLTQSCNREISFQVDFHPFGKSEFLVLYHRFAFSIAQSPLFEIGAQVQIVTLNDEDEEELSTGVITNCANRDEAWPDSPWEAFECKMDSNGTFEYFSPWQLELLSKNTSSSMTTTTTTTTVTPKISPHTIRFWTQCKDSIPITQWISDQIQATPLSLSKLNKSKSSKHPMPMSIGLVCERLLFNKYYRQWEALEADISQACTIGSLSKANLEEFLEIVYFAKTGQDECQDLVVEWNSFQTQVLEALEATMSVDKEGYFREPVDVDAVPDYLEIIFHPMDFSTIRAKIESWTEPEEAFLSLAFARRLVRSVVADIKQVSLNATQYNQETTLVFRRAKEVVKKMTETFGKLDFTKRTTNGRDVFIEEESASGEEEVEDDDLYQGRTNISRGLRRNPRAARSTRAKQHQQESVVHPRPRTRQQQHVVKVDEKRTVKSKIKLPKKSPSVESEDDDEEDEEDGSVSDDEDVFEEEESSDVSEDEASEEEEANEIEARATRRETRQRNQENLPLLGTTKRGLSKRAAVEALDEVPERKQLRRRQSPTTQTAVRRPNPRKRLIVDEEEEDDAPLISSEEDDDDEFVTSSEEVSEQVSSTLRRTTRRRSSVGAQNEATQVPKKVLPLRNARNKVTYQESEEIPRESKKRRETSDEEEIVPTSRKAKAASNARVFEDEEVVAPKSRRAKKRNEVSENEDEEILPTPRNRRTAVVSENEDEEVLPTPRNRRRSVVVSEDEDEEVLPKPRSRPSVVVSEDEEVLPKLRRARTRRQDEDDDDDAVFQPHSTTRSGRHLRK